jgi:hypothetical protein
MPHKEILSWPGWIEEIAEQDPCLGRMIREAVVAHDAAVNAGADKKTASKRCRDAFKSAAMTLDVLQRGAVRPNTDAAWKKASDALRKFTQALDCAAPQQQFAGLRKKARGDHRPR